MTQDQTQRATCGHVLQGPTIRSTSKVLKVVVRTSRVEETSYQTVTESLILTSKL